MDINTASRRSELQSIGYEVADNLGDLVLVCPYSRRGAARDICVHFQRYS
jgi:hypothetical protein